MGEALRKGCSDFATHKTWCLLQYTHALDMLQPLCLATSVHEASVHLLQYGLSNYFATAQMPLTFHATIICRTVFPMLVVILVQDCLEMRCVGSSTDGLPPGVGTIPGPRTQRQVLHACHRFDYQLSCQVLAPNLEQHYSRRTWVENSRPAHV